MKSVIKHKLAINIPTTTAIQDVGVCYGFSLLSVLPEEKKDEV